MAECSDTAGADLLPRLPPAPRRQPVRHVFIKDLPPELADALAELATLRHLSSHATARQVLAIFIPELLKRERQSPEPTTAEGGQG